MTPILRNPPRVVARQRPMARPASLPCTACEGMLTRVAETREDPEHPLGPAVWRLRRCDDCGQDFASVEQPVSLLEAQDRLAALARERTMLARAGRRPDRRLVGVAMAARR